MTSRWPQCTPSKVPTVTTVAPMSVGSSASLPAPMIRTSADLAHDNARLPRGAEDLGARRRELDRDTRARRVVCAASGDALRGIRRRYLIENAGEPLDRVSNRGIGWRLGLTNDRAVQVIRVRLATQRDAGLVFLG